LLPDAASLFDEILERHYFTFELIEFQGRGILIGEQIPRCFVEIIFFLFGIWESSLYDCQSPRPLWGCQVLQLFQQILLFL
jgi:hypothetical protein